MTDGIDAQRSRPSRLGCPRFSGSGAGREVAVRLEAIRSHQKSRTTSLCSRHEKMADSKGAQRLAIQIHRTRLNRESQMPPFVRPMVGPHYRIANLVEKRPTFCVLPDPFQGAEAEPAPTGRGVAFVRSFGTRVGWTPTRTADGGISGTIESSEAHPSKRLK
jgi:hypothetical protein